MTTKEFSDAFDTIVASYSKDINFNEYEKSLYLTLAQEQIVIDLYTGGIVKVEGFESTEELRAYLRNLIKTEVIDKKEQLEKAISDNSYFFRLPSDVLFITYEVATIDDSNAECKDKTTIDVVPVTQDEFNRIKRNPFRTSNERRALRLDNGLDIVEIVSKYNLSKYTVRYLSKPTPIVLANFDEVTINKENKITECKLDSALHSYILRKAVSLGIAAKSEQNK